MRNIPPIEAWLQSAPSSNRNRGDRLPGRGRRLRGSAIFRKRRLLTTPTFSPEPPLLRVAAKPANWIRRRCGVSADLTTGRPVNFRMRRRRSHLRWSYPRLGTTRPSQCCSKRYDSPAIRRDAFEDILILSRPTSISRFSRCGARAALQAAGGRLAAPTNQVQVLRTSRWNYFPVAGRIGRPDYARAAAAGHPFIQHPCSSPDDDRYLPPGARIRPVSVEGAL